MSWTVVASAASLVPQRPLYRLRIRGPRGFVFETHYFEDEMSARRFRRDPTEGRSWSKPSRRGETRQDWEDWP